MVRAPSSLAAPNSATAEPLERQCDALGAARRLPRGLDVKVVLRVQPPHLRRGGLDLDVVLGARGAQPLDEIRRAVGGVAVHFQGRIRRGVARGTPSRTPHRTASQSQSPSRCRGAVSYGNAPSRSYSTSSPVSQYSTRSASAATVRT
jgi:hypothetical protein